MSLEDMAVFGHIFRIDDVSVNTDALALGEIISVIQKHVPKVHIILAVSSLVHDLKNEPEADRERAFPRILGAMSDHREYFKVGRIGVPEAARHYPVASHGLVHVDHRLLSKDVQEFSILTSCALLNTTIFVPPFNKYNEATEEVCRKHGLQLVRFEEGWKHVKWNKFERNKLGPLRYYLHTHDVNSEWMERWLGA